MRASDIAKTLKALALVYLLNEQGFPLALDSTLVERER